MTRYGASQLQAAGAAPPARDPRTPVVIIAVDSVATSCVPGRQYTAEAQRSGLSASIADQHIFEGAWVGGPLAKDFQEHFRGREVAAMSIFKQTGLHQLSLPSISGSGMTPLPEKWPHFLGNIWSSICTADAPARSTSRIVL